MLDDPARTDKVGASVKLLNKLARILRQRRIDEGALTLASPEVSTVCERTKKHINIFYFLLITFHRRFLHSVILFVNSTQLAFNLFTHFVIFYYYLGAI